MRLLGWIVVVSLALALLRLTIILALILLGMALVWAIISKPNVTVPALVLLAASSIANTHAGLAVAALICGLLIWRVDSGAES